MTSNVRIGVTFAGVFALLGVGSMLLDRHATVGAAPVQAPRCEVDPMWPKPLPNHWIMGSTIGVSVDAKDHVWVIHRGAGTLEPKEMFAASTPPASDCCAPAPPVLEF